MVIEYKEMNTKEKNDITYIHNWKGWFRYFIKHTCPKCNGGLLEVGYYDPGIGQKYKCENRKCAWGW